MDASGTPRSDGDMSSMYATPSANAADPDGLVAGGGEFTRELDYFHQQFCDALNGPFAVCGYVDSMPLPEIFVDGVGHLSLDRPYEEAAGLGGDQAELLLQQYRSVGSSAVSGSSADPGGKTCFVRTSNLTVQNADEWNEFIGRAVARVTDELGLGVPTLATLRGMRVVGKGAAYRDQLDMSRSQGVFGTLTIALPSLHDGGINLARYKGEKKTFFSKSWSYQNYAAWFSDVRHDLTVVKDGYCWTLVYDLVVDHRSSGLQKQFLPTAESRRGSELALRKLFEAYAERCKRLEHLTRDPPKYVMHILDSESTPDALNIERLTPEDATRVRMLNDVCLPLGFEVFLARVRKAWSGPRDTTRSRQKSLKPMSEESEPDTDREFSSGAPPQGPCEKKVGIRALGKVNGEPILFDDTVAETNQINLAPPYFEMSQKDPFGPTPDSEEVKRPTKEMKYFSAIQTWNRTAVLVIPHRYTFEILACSFYTGFDVDGHGKNAFSTYILDRFLAAPDDAIAARDAVALLHEVTRLSADDAPIPWQPSGALRGKIVQYALKTSNFALLDEYTGVAKKMESPLPPDVFKWIGEYLKSQPKTTLRRTKDALMRAIQAYNSLGPRFQAVVHMAPPEQILPPELFVFVREALPINSFAKLLAGFEDGEALVDVAVSYYDADTFFNAIVPLLKERATNAPLVIGFLSKLLELFDTSPFFEAIQKKEFYTHVAQYCIPKMQICAATKCEETEDGTLKSKLALEPARLVKFFLDLAKQNMMPEIDMMVKNILESREEIRGTPECTHFWLPFLKQLIDLYQENDLSYAAPPYRYLYRGILEVYLFRYVEPEPPASEPSLVRTYRPARGTEDPPCELCQGAEAFLLSATRREVTYQLPALKRKHVEEWFHDDWPAHNRTIPGIRKTLNKEAKPYYTVTFRKTSSWDPDARAERAKRRAKAELELVRFNQAALRDILGPDFQGVMDMTVLRRGAQQVEMPAAAEAPPGATELGTADGDPRHAASFGQGSSPPAMAGVKRKLEEAMGLLAAAQGGRGGGGDRIANMRRKIEEVLQLAEG